MRFSDMSPGLQSGPQVKLVCPAVFALVVREPVCFGDRRHLGQTIGGNVVRVDSACGFHASMDRFAVDTGVDQQMHNVDVLGTKLSRHGLRDRAQAKLGRSERGESLSASNTGRRPCKQDCPAAATSHVVCGFAPHEKSSIARKLPGFKEQLLGGFQQRLVHIRTGVEKTDFDGTDILLDLGKQLLAFISSASDLDFSASRRAMQTLYPPSAKRRATAAPIASPAPTRRATPFDFDMFISRTSDLIRRDPHRFIRDHPFYGAIAVAKLTKNLV